MKWYIVLIISCITLIHTYGQSAHKSLLEGDQSYQQEDYLSAEEHYRKAQEKKSSTKSNFNLGNAVYQQDRFEEAVQHYENTFNIATNDQERANALYNLGNAQLKGGQIEPAIESYKKANAFNPDDIDILKNLYMAKLMMQQEQENQQQQEQQQQEQENQEQQEQNNEQQQQEQNEGEEEQQQQPQDSDIENQSEQEQQAPQDQELSKEDALKLLEVIENEEKNVQEKLRKMSGDKKKPKKDW